MQVINLTPFPIYIRLGDHLPAGSTSYHLVIPPATTTSTAIETDLVSLYMDATNLGTSTTLLRQAQIIFTRGEVNVPFQQMKLATQAGQTYAIPSMPSGGSTSFVFDARGYAALAVTIVAAAGDTLGLSVDVSADRVQWVSLQSFLIYTGGTAAQQFTTFLINLFGYFQLTVHNDGLSDSLSTYMVINMLDAVPPVEYFQHRYTMSGSVWVSNQTSPAYVTVINRPHLSGVIKHLWVSVTCPYLTGGTGFADQPTVEVTWLINGDKSTHIFLNEPDLITVSTGTQKQTAVWDRDIYVPCTQSLVGLAVVTAPGSLQTIDTIQMEYILEVAG
jgi:hypothetical protein